MKKNRHLFIDQVLKTIIDNRLDQVIPKLLVVGTGITSSHLGDERNLREFLFAAEVVSYLRSNNYAVLFLLIDDSYDPLNFRQLRVAVNKDEKLIKKFEKYCGMPIIFIPDPYDCHDSYSAHFRSEILDRFNSYGIYPNIIDTYAAYSSGLYDFAKDIIFPRFKEINSFLKKKFPDYSMKKIFYPVCPDCHMLEGVELLRVTGAKIYIHCHHCKKKSSHLGKKALGKFSWKIDAAIKWNLYKTDFEPFSKAYLDPDVGSYVIAKSLSEEFFGGNVPEVIEYGQVLMDKSFSYVLMNALPLTAFRNLYLERRKSDINISSQKIVQIAKEFIVDVDLTYYNYVQTRLPYDILESLNGALTDPFWLTLMNHGKTFSKSILKREAQPALPATEKLNQISKRARNQIKGLLLWTIRERNKDHHSFEEFNNVLQLYIKKKRINKSKLYPVIRELLSQQHGVPLRRLLHFVPLHYLYACVSLIDESK